MNVYLIIFQRSIWWNEYGRNTRLVDGLFLMDLKEEILENTKTLLLQSDELIHEGKNYWKYLPTNRGVYCAFLSILIPHLDPFFPQWTSMRRAGQSKMFRDIKI